VFAHFLGLLFLCLFQISISIGHKRTEIIQLRIWFLWHLNNILGWLDLLLDDELPQVRTRSFRIDLLKRLFLALYLIWFGLNQTRAGFLLWTQRRFLSFLAGFRNGGPWG
jgi:hypothetical protein